VRATGTAAREVRIQTRNGPIEVAGASGPVWLRNSYGDVTVSEGQEVTLDVEMNDGAFTFQGALSGTSGHRIVSEVGDVTLRLPSDTALWLDAATRRGRIEVELPVEAQGSGDEEPGGSDEQQLEGPINGGETRLRIKVRDGDITLETN
jgi:hypothetical protein